MGLFGLNRTEVNDIARAHSDEQRNKVERYLEDTISTERKRICQTVSILLATLPKAILSKKVKRSDIPYGTQVLPSHWFEDSGDKDDKLTFEQILKYIDP